MTIALFLSSGLFLVHFVRLEERIGGTGGGGFRLVFTAGAGAAADAIAGAIGI